MLKFVPKNSPYVLAKNICHSDLEKHEINKYSKYKTKILPYSVPGTSTIQLLYVSNCGRNILVTY